MFFLIMRTLFLSVLQMLGIGAKMPSFLSEANSTTMSMFTPVVLNMPVWLTSSMSVRDTYRCRNERYGYVYDKGVLIEVSRDLGHNRCDVVVNHYMK